MADAVAILIDFENLVLGLQNGMQADQVPANDTESEPSLPLDMGLFFKLAEEEGPVALAAAYADWRLGVYNRHQVDLYRHGIELVHVLGKNYKNAVDVRMAVDAVEMVFERPHVKTFVVVSGDRDFIHVLKALRKHNKRIIGVAPARSASEDLASLCDRFVTYRALWTTHHITHLNRTEAGGDAEEPDESLDELKPRLALLLADLASEDGLAGAQLKPLIRRHISPAFDESSYGFSKLTNLLRAMPDVVRLVRTPDGDVRVFPVLSRPEAEALARLAGGPEAVEEEPLRRFAAQARDRLTHWRYEWARDRRRRILAAIHRAMRDRPSFTQEVIIQRVRDASDEPITTTQLARYLSVCYQSMMFDIEATDRDLPVRARRLALREEFEPKADFVARYEQSILYKVSEYLPEDVKDAVAFGCYLLGVGDDPEERDYVRELVAKLSER